MVKISPEIINFLFFCPEKIKYYPDKKYAQIFEKFTKKKKKLPSHRVQPVFFCALRVRRMVIVGSSGELCERYGKWGTWFQC